MDTATWENAEIGAYMRLLNYSWINGGLPDDIRKLAKIAREGVEVFEQMWKDTISTKFHAVAGTLYNHRQEEEREKRTRYKEKQRLNGKRGGRPKEKATEKPEETQTKPNPFLNQNPNKTFSIENEKEYEIEIEDTVKEGVQGEENHLADLSADANDLLHSMINFFGIREHIDNLKYRLVYKFLENMTAWGEFDSARQQIIAYMQFKATASEKPHGVENFLGDYEKRYHNGAWFQTDWTKKLSNNGTNQRTGTAKVGYGEKFTGFGSFEKS